MKYLKCAVDERPVIILINVHAAWSDYLMILTKFFTCF